MASVCWPRVAPEPVGVPSDIEALSRAAEAGRTAVTLTHPLCCHRWPGSHQVSGHQRTPGQVSDVPPLATSRPDASLNCRYRTEDCSCFVAVASVLRCVVTGPPAPTTHHFGVLAASCATVLLLSVALPAALAQQLNYSLASGILTDEQIQSNPGQWYKFVVDGFQGVNDNPPSPTPHTSITNRGCTLTLTMSDIALGLPGTLTKVTIVETGLQITGNYTMTYVLTPSGQAPGPFGCVSNSCGSFPMSAECTYDVLVHAAPQNLEQAGLGISGATFRCSNVASSNCHCTSPDVCAGSQTTDTPSLVTAYVTALVKDSFARAVQNSITLSDVSKITYSVTPEHLFFNTTSIPPSISAAFNGTLWSRVGEEWVPYNASGGASSLPTNLPTHTDTTPRRVVMAGVRTSEQLVAGLMWAANETGVFRGAYNATILDARLDFYFSFDPPGVEISPTDNCFQLNSSVANLTATCHPSNVQGAPVVFLSALVYNFTASGNVTFSETNEAQLHLFNFNVTCSDDAIGDCIKMTQPDIPLGNNVLQKIALRVIEKAEPLVNDYLGTHPVNIPFLSGDGMKTNVEVTWDTGFMQTLSSCGCDEDDIFQCPDMGPCKSEPAPPRDEPMDVVPWYPPLGAPRARPPPPLRSHKRVYAAKFHEPSCTVNRDAGSMSISRLDDTKGNCTEMPRLSTMFYSLDGRTIHYICNRSEEGKCVNCQFQLHGFDHDVCYPKDSASLLLSEAACFTPASVSALANHSLFIQMFNVDLCDNAPEVTRNIGPWDNKLRCDVDGYCSRANCTPFDSPTTCHTIRAGCDIDQPNNCTVSLNDVLMSAHACLPAQTQSDTHFRVFLGYDIQDKDYPCKAPLWAPSAHTGVGIAVVVMFCLYALWLLFIGKAWTRYQHSVPLWVYMISEKVWHWLDSSAVLLIVVAMFLGAALNFVLGAFWVTHGPLEFFREQVSEGFGLPSGLVDVTSVEKALHTWAVVSSVFTILGAVGITVLLGVALWRRSQRWIKVFGAWMLFESFVCWACVALPLTSIPFRHLSTIRLDTAFEEIKADMNEAAGYTVTLSLVMYVVCLLAHFLLGLAGGLSVMCAYLAMRKGGEFIGSILSILLVMVVVSLTFPCIFLCQAAVSDWSWVVCWAAFLAALSSLALQVNTLRRGVAVPPPLRLGVTLVFVTTVYFLMTGYLLARERNFLPPHVMPFFIAFQLAVLVTISLGLLFLLSGWVGAFEAAQEKADGAGDDVAAGALEEPFLDEGAGQEEALLCVNEAPGDGAQEEQSDRDLDEEGEAMESVGRQIWLFLSEDREKRNPQAWGWRIPFRRILLIIGFISASVFFVKQYQEMSNFTPKEAMDDVLQILKIDVHWPDSDIVVGPALEVYRTTANIQLWLFFAAVVCIFLAMLADILSSILGPMTRRAHIGGLLFSRRAVAAAAVLVLCALFAPAVPNYVSYIRIDDLCPFCAPNFNAFVRDFANSMIGAAVSLLFTLATLPALVAMPPAFLRALALLISHASMRGRERALHRQVLWYLFVMSCVLPCLLLFVPLAVVFQTLGDGFLTFLVLVFMVAPFILSLTFLLLPHLKKHPYKLYVGWLVAYGGLLFLMLWYAVLRHGYWDVLASYLQSPRMWMELISEVALSSVVLGDLLCVVAP